MFFACGLLSRFLHFIRVFNGIIERNLMCYYIIDAILVSRQWIFYDVNPELLGLAHQ